MMPKSTTIALFCALFSTAILAFADKTSLPDFSCPAKADLLPNLPLVIDLVPNTGEGYLRPNDDCDITCLVLPGITENPIRQTCDIPHMGPQAIPFVLALEEVNSEREIRIVTLCYPQENTAYLYSFPVGDNWHMFDQGNNTLAIELDGQLVGEVFFNFFSMDLVVTIYPGHRFTTTDYCVGENPDTDWPPTLDPSIPSQSLISDVATGTAAVAANFPERHTRSISPSSFHSLESTQVVNPAEASLEIRFTYPAPTAVYLTLYTAGGKPLRTLTLDGGLPYHSLSVTDLPPGLYFLHLASGQQTVTRRFVKV